MLFFIALPIALLLWAPLDILVQQARHDFVDLAATARRLLLATLAWACLGWLLEASAATDLATRLEGRMQAVEMDLGALEDSVLRYIQQ